MKTTFKNEWNKMEDDFNMDETTIYEELHIDTDKIVSHVMQSIHTENTTDSKTTTNNSKTTTNNSKTTTNISPMNSKTRNRKKLPLILIAAAISTAIIGTTVLAATGLLSFSDKFKGDTSAIPVYENNTFRFDTKDDNLQASLKGMTGDGDFTLAAIELTKKDGGLFFKETEMVLPTGSSCYDSSCFRYQIDRPDGTMVTDPNPFHTDAAEYYLSPDGKTLTLYLSIQTSNYDPKGTKVSFHSDKIYTYHTTELLKSCNILDEATYYDTLSLYENQSCQWFYRDGKYNFYAIESTASPLSFDCSLELEKKLNDEMTITLDSKTAPDIVNPDQTVTMKISPFKINLESNQTYTSQQVQDQLVKKGKLNEDEKAVLTEDFLFRYQDNLSAFHAVYPFAPELMDVQESMVIMKDNSVYYFYQYNNTDYEIQEDRASMRETRTLIYTDVPCDGVFSFEDTEDLRPYVLDPSQIACILINNQKVYTAEDAQDIAIPETDHVLLHCWSPYEIRNLLINDPVDILSLNIAESTAENGYQYSEIIFDFAGTDSDVADTIKMLAQESNRGLFIEQISLYPQDRDENRYEVSVSMVNSYILTKTDSYDSIKQSILTRWPQYDWGTFCERFIYYDKAPDENIPIIKQNRSVTDSSGQESEEELTEEPVRPLPTNTVSEPERDPLNHADLTNFEVRNWSEKELLAQVQEQIGISSEQTGFSDVTWNSGMDINLDAREMSLSFTASKNEVYNIVNRLLLLEEKDIFVSKVMMTAVSENNGNYEVILSVLNPYAMSSSQKNDAEIKDIILDQFSGISKPEILSALYRDVFEQTEVERIATNFYPNDDKAVTSASILQILIRDGVFDDFLRLKESFSSQNSVFTITENVTASKVETESGHDAIRCVIELTTSSF